MEHKTLQELKIFSIGTNTTKQKKTLFFFTILFKLHLFQVKQSETAYDCKFFKRLHIHIDDASLYVVYDFL